MKKNKNNILKATISCGLIILITISSISYAVDINIATTNTEKSITRSIKNHKQPLDNVLFPTPHIIWGYAQYDGGGWAVNAEVEVHTSDSSIDPENRTLYSTVDSEGAWQVDCGDPGVNWPTGTDFTVWINGTGSYEGWQGKKTGTVSSGNQDDMGTIILYYDENNPPNEPSNPIPGDGETVDTPVVLSVFVSDPDDDSMTVRFYVDDSLVDEVTGVTNGTRADSSALSYAPNSSHEWYAQADDGEFMVNSDIWYFNISEDTPPEPKLSLITGFITNKTEDNDFVYFEATLVFYLPLTTMTSDIVTNNMKMLMSKPYFGIVTDKFIFVIGKAGYQ